MNIFNNERILKKNNKSLTNIYDQFNSNILIMPDSIALKVPLNKKGTESRK